METSIISFIQNMIAEALSFWFLFGLVLFLVGSAMIGLFLWTRIMGKSVTGTVIGAIQETRIKKKIRDGKEIEKIKKTLYPIYEYTRPDGTTHTERSSEGGSMTLKYETGQHVNLLILQNDLYDDVYDRNEMGALYLGLILSAIGGVLMVKIGDSLIHALGMSALSIAVMLIFKVGTALLAKEKPTKTKKKQETATPAKKHHKAFKLEDVLPIEDFK